MKLSGKTVCLTAVAATAVAILGCLPAYAATIYKSIDENGVARFSDTRPTDGAVVETVVIEETATPPSGQAQQRLQDMRETTDRMVADRMAREKHRAQMRQLDAQIAAQQAAQDTPEYTDTSPLYLGYYGYPVRRPWRPWHGNKPRPEHPIAHPPLRPPVGKRVTGKRPLPDYDYPASLIRKSYDPKVREALLR